MRTSRITKIRVELVIWLLLLTLTPLLAQNQAYLRRNSQPKRIKRTKNRGGFPGTYNITGSVLDQVRNERRGDQPEDGRDSRRDDVPHMTSSGMRRPRDLPKYLQSGATPRQDLPDDPVVLKEAPRFRPRDKPIMFDSTKPLNDMVQDLLASEKQMDEAPVADSLIVLNNSIVSDPQAPPTVSVINNRPVSVINNRPVNSTTKDNETSANEADVEPIVFFVESNVTEQAPMTLQNVTNTTDEEPMPFLNETNTTDEEPAVFLNETNTTDEEPMLFLNETNTTDEEPMLFLNETNTTDDEPMLLEEEETVFGINAPAFRPNVCGNTREEAEATCASKLSCSRALPGEDCYPECTTLEDDSTCKNGEECISVVNGCLGFASLPTDLEDSVFTRLKVDDKEMKRSKRRGGK